MKLIQLKNHNIDVVNEHLEAIIHQKIQSRGLEHREEKDDALFLCDIGDILKKYKTWQSLLPRVKPFYAVKCNDDPAILSALAELGTGFDCASKMELQKVLELGVSPERIVYANPCKQNSHIRYAAKHQVDLMTFDNETELHKIKATFPTAKLLLRILPPESTKCQCELGIKFGTHPKNATNLLQVAKLLNLAVVGVSFHVGSGCYDATAFSAAVATARPVFDLASDMGFDFTILDIGGGFPGQKSAKITFEEICEELRPALDVYFPEGEGVDIIAEPGRFFAASAYTLVVNVIAKRKIPRDRTAEQETDLVCTADDEPQFMYYVNDGVYGSFNCLLFDHATVKTSLLDPKMYTDLPLYTSSVWGPTCDGLDCISEKEDLPELDIGDWLVYQDMGAYTLSAASGFNGMAKPKCYYTVREDCWGELLELSRQSSHHQYLAKENPGAAMKPASFIPTLIKPGRSLGEQHDMGAIQMSA